ncbi:hypothetical protein [Polaribacter porphyrae]|uniref:Uncharacterized protein n=1 Tax=Polaribacter porphyrae TaxID=1137780 RepID=A0A2S7WKV1_9FLAO|nr:hypothetical protein [Polaribacter porphyrae]PQJ78237.1 hypothetical protein BTO18_03095 [Polaribacter porphyrae]
MNKKSTKITNLIAIFIGIAGVAASTYLFVKGKPFQNIILGFVCSVSLIGVGYLNSCKTK